MNKKEMKLIPRSSHIIRVIAGIWLLYLVYQMKHVFETEFGIEFILLIIIMILFVLIAIFLLLKSGLRLYRGEYIGGKGDLEGHMNEKE